MNSEDIIHMALEAGMLLKRFDVFSAELPDLERFASLVAAAERHECAKIVDGNADACDGLMEQVLRSNAAAIRARGQACPPCNGDCNQGRDCPARSQK